MVIFGDLWRLGFMPLMNLLEDSSCFLVFVDSDLCDWKEKVGKCFYDVAPFCVENVSFFDTVYPLYNCHL